MSTYNFTIASDVSTILKDGVLLRQFYGNKSAYLDPNFDGDGTTLVGFTLNLRSHNYSKVFHLQVSGVPNVFQVGGSPITITDVASLITFGNSLAAVFPKAGGAASLTSTPNDLTFTDYTKGVVLVSQSGKKARFTLVDNADGTVSLQQSEPF